MNQKLGRTAELNRAVWRRNLYKALVGMFIAMMLPLVTDGQIARAQSNAPRFEIGGQFAAIRADNSPGSTFFQGRPGDRLDLGGGGRFTVNLNRHIALESEVNFFREKVTFDLPTRLTSSGTKTEGLFGAKEINLVCSANCGQGLCISIEILIALAAVFKAILSSR
jgi:hypothetical protein